MHSEINISFNHYRIISIWFLNRSDGENLFVRFICVLSKVYNLQTFIGPSSKHVNPS